MECVLKWDNFAQYTVGKQIVNSSDSVGANIAEGTGNNVESKRYCKIARGSLFETKLWLKRAAIRNFFLKMKKLK